LSTLKWSRWRSSSSFASSSLPHLQRLGELLLFDRIALCEPLPGGDGGDQDPEDQRHDRQAEVRGRRAVGIRVAREGGRDNLRRLGDRRLAAGFEAPAPGGRRAT